MTSLLAHLQRRRPKELPPAVPVEVPVEALVGLLGGSAVVVIQHVDVETLAMFLSWLAPSVGTQDRRYGKSHPQQNFPSAFDTIHFASHP